MLSIKYINIKEDIVLMFSITKTINTKIVITLVRSVKYERRVIFTLFQCFDLEIMFFDDVPGGSFKNFKRAGCKSNIHI